MTQLMKLYKCLDCGTLYMDDCGPGWCDRCEDHNIVEVKSK